MMGNHIARYALLNFSIAVLLGNPFVLAQTMPATQMTNAAELYSRAAKKIIAQCPSNSSISYPEYPPYGPEWEKLAADAWLKNTKAFKLIRDARKLTTADWKATLNATDGSYAFCRSLANNLHDAALYHHFQNQDAAALELMLDELHMAKLIGDGPKQRELLRTLVAVGIELDFCYHLELISASATFSSADHPSQAISVTATRKLIASLLKDQPPPEDEFSLHLDADGHLRDTNGQLEDGIKSTFFRTWNQLNAEKSFTAIALALHLFRLETHRWPLSLDELVPNYLPYIPVDPYGDGKQTFALAIIKRGLPNGSDRFLIYNRCGAKDMLFFRTDEPVYWFEPAHQYGTGEPRKTGGQFRDVTAWVPKFPPKHTPTTRPLP